MIRSLIRSLYLDDCPWPLAEAGYAEALPQIEAEGIAPQLYVLLKRRGALAGTPGFFRQRLETLAKAALYRNLFLKRQGERILAAFEASGIDVLPLKGVWFSEAYFGHPGARETSDIDLLIRPDGTEPASRLVHALGFEAEEARQIRGHFHTSFTMPVPGSPIPHIVELHWHIMRPETADIRMEAIWSAAAELPGTRHVKRLSHDDAFYLICLHGWRHNLDALKYHLDMVQMIFVLKDRLCYDALLRRAAEERTYTRIVRTLSIVYCSFPFLQAVKPFPALRPPRWRDCGGARPPARSLKRYADLLDYQLFSYDCARHRLAALKEWLGELASGGAR